MKIGILTMNYAQNYGGVLQTYGLFQYLKGQGHSVCVINYRNSGHNSVAGLIAKLERRFAEENASRPAKMLPKRPLTEEYKQNFIDFKNSYLDYTEPVDELGISKVCAELEAVIVGSDQIWNDVFTNKLAYYFDWKFQGKKIAYAACTIYRDPLKSRRFYIRKLLRQFNCLTVRDENTAHYVTEFGLPKPQIVVDPSCLYDYHDLIYANPIGKPYILTYILSDEISGGNANAIRLIKESTGDIPVVSVCIPSVSVVAESISDIFIENATLAEWVTLFYHAAFVYTDSFHGIMFSMKFKKQFIAYMKDGQRKSRLQDLIQRYGIKNIVTNAEAIRQAISSPVEYAVITPILASNIKESKRLLNETLNS